MFCQKYMFKKILLLFVFCFFSGYTFSAPQSSGKVERLYVQKAGLVLFRLGKSSDLPEPCSDANWPYEFMITDTAGAAWLSYLLAAKAQGESLAIGYIPQPGRNRCKVEYLYQ